MPGDPFRIAILGDFGGQASKLAPVAIDIDNFDQVLKSLGVSLELPLAGRISFRELDDFHPDRLYERVAIFEPLRHALISVPVAQKASSAVSNIAPALRTGSLLDEMVEAAGSRDPLRAWVSEQTAPHVIPKIPAADVERRELVKSVVAAQMRALLHYPELQELEALWRSVAFLVKRCVSEPGVSVHLIDIDKQKLVLDLADGPGEIAEVLHHHGEWALIVGAYTFGSAKTDLQMLTALGEVCARLNVSFVGAAKLQLVGCENIETLAEPREWTAPSSDWDEFRSTAAAKHVGLAMPRFLVRLPYGAKTDACELIAFEEMGEEYDHERLLWGNPAIACAALLAASFGEDGWSMRPGKHSNLDGLPTYVYQRDGDFVAQPCAETIMTERAAKAIQDCGVMCLASIKDTDEVRLVRFQCSSKVVGPLNGPWTHV
jgi:type VI secretion system protein ImpC